MGLDSLRAFTILGPASGIGGENAYLVNFDRAKHQLSVEQLSAVKI